MDRLVPDRAAYAVVAVARDVAEQVGGVDCQDTAREGAASDGRPWRAPRIGHGHEVVSGVVSVFDGLTNVVHSALQTVQAVVKEGSQEDFIGDAAACDLSTSRVSIVEAPTETQQGIASRVLVDLLDRFRALDA